jgi:hypothetical protein
MTALKEAQLTKQREQSSEGTEEDEGVDVADGKFCSNNKTTRVLIFMLESSISRNNFSVVFMIICG